MSHTPDIQRPSRELIEGLRHIGSATATGELSRLGIRDPQIRGPVAWTPGKTVVGPALTLQMMPKREDLYGEDEYTDPERQLHRHVLYHTQPGDVVVVDARGDMGSGIFGEMMLTYFKGRGGAGVIIDGCIRDYPKAKDLGLGLWLRGVTPNYHTQTNLFPFAVNVPVACGDTLVMPGDIIATGTPAGVGQGENPKSFLKAGDVVVTEIEGIGRMVNRIVPSGTSVAANPAAETEKEVGLARA